MGFRWRIQQCLYIPAYIVVLPRPLKPPLLSKTSYSNKYCITITLIPSNTDSLRTVPQRTYAFMACTPHTTLQLRSYHTLAMATNFGAISPVSWLDECILQPLYDINTDSISLTQVSFNNHTEPEVPQELHPLQWNNLEISSINKRSINSISDQDDQSCHKPRKRTRIGTTAPASKKSKDIFSTFTSPTSTRRHPGALAAARSKLFACPVLKRFGEKALNAKDRKCCVGPGPGWTIHRLK